MSAFERAHRFVAAHEGGFTANPADPGNWTGRVVGRGVLKGTNWGISAGAYPDLDIRSLTREEAHAIYKRDYWDRLRCDDLPPPLALLVYDCGVNAGIGRAARLLQTAAGTKVDGVIGPKTLEAVARKPLADMLAEFQAQRLLFMASLPTWATFCKGWARRLCALPYQAVQMGVE